MRSHACKHSAGAWRAGGLICAALLLAACGGGGGGDGGSGDGPPPPTYGIGGYVHKQGGGVSGSPAFAGVTVRLSGAAVATQTTDSTGYYAFSGLASGTYHIAAERAGYTPSPATRDVTVTSADIAGCPPNCWYGGDTWFNLVFVKVVQIAAGDQHSLALKEGGAVYAWGDNFYGQLGNGSTIDATTPVAVPGPANVTAIAAGTEHSLARVADGTVWAWGRNQSGQLGDGTTFGRWVPVRPQGLTSVTAVAAGDQHSLALKSDGTVWAWGDNFYGQLGDGTQTDRPTPVRVNGLTAVAAISAGLHHSLALKDDGSVWAWGRGPVGDGTYSNRATAVQVIGMGTATAVAGGGYHSLALLDDGTVWAWGPNQAGQLGDNSTTTRTSPVQVTLAPYTGQMASVEAGMLHSVARAYTGSRIQLWGDNVCGQLGDGTRTGRIAPVEVTVPGLGSIAAVAAGTEHTLALKSTGRIYAWGSGGLLGDGTYVDRLTPAEVPDF